MSDSKKVSVEISKELLNKLAWAYPAGNIEERVDFCLAKMVEGAEKEEGMKYPSDLPPCKTFEHVKVTT
jgi:hypothetical protein